VGGKKRTFFVLLNKNGRSHLKTTTNKKALLILYFSSGKLFKETKHFQDKKNNAQIVFLLNI